MSELQANDLQNETHQTGNAISVWDIPVRVFHWLLVSSIIGAYVTHELGIDYFQYHLWFGYLAIVLVIFRIIWGAIGTHHARFANFVAGPVAIKRYAKNMMMGRDMHYAGHNPLGALMVLALIVGMLVQAVCGLFSTDEIFNVGPLYSYVSEELSLQLTSLHRQLFYWIIAAIIIHVVAVIAHSYLKKDNLIKAMITGKKEMPLADEVSIKSSKVTFALVVFGVVSGLLYCVIALSAQS